MNQGGGGGAQGAGEDAGAHSAGVSSPAPRSLSPAASIFGRQRPPADLAALLLLLAGFSALGVGFWILTANWSGLLLPLAFLLGIMPPLLREVREIELREDTLMVRTFFRAYPIPRAHIKAALRTPDGVAVEVLNGNHYLVTPPDTDVPALAAALEKWLAG